MAIKSKSRYAILGILNIAPGSGYDIKKYCDTVISNIWNENYGHIYPMLKSLEEEGVIMQLPRNEMERKNKYAITEAGQRELINWLEEETISQPVRSEFMLKFLFSSNLNKDKVLQMLANYREEQNRNLLKNKRMLEELNREIKEVSSERELYLRATLHRGIISLEGSLRWCDETIQDFKHKMQ